MKNQLWNEHLSSRQEAKELYKLFFEMNDYQYIRNPNAWQGMKIISRQYLRARDEVQGLAEPADIAKWINENQHRFFNVPLQHVFPDRRPVRFNRFEWMTFEPSRDVPINERFYHLQFFEEDIEGEGYRGEFRIYIPYNPLRYDDGAIKVAMASFGIYPFEVTFNSNDEGRFLEGRFVMLKSNWKFTVDPEFWNIGDRDSTLFMDNEQYERYLDARLDDMDEEEKDEFFARDKAKAIEDGYDPEDPDDD